MTEISKEWCINMAKQEEGDIGAGKLAIDPTSDNFHKLALSESFERVAKVAEERQAFNEAMATAETDRLERELDITNADNIALWLEANVIPHDALRLCLNWLAVQIVEAHEAALRQPTQNDIIQTALVKDRLAAIRCEHRKDEHD